MKILTSGLHLMNLFLEVHSSVAGCTMNTDRDFLHYLNVLEIEQTLNNMHE